MDRKNKSIKQRLLVILLLIIIMLPNLLLITIGEDSVVASLLKKVAFGTLCLSVILLPLAFLKSKYYSFFILLLVPLILFETSFINHFKAPTSEEAVASIFLTNYYEISELIKGNIGAFLTGILFFIIVLFISLLVKKSYSIPLKNKKIFIAFFLITFSALYGRNFYAATKLKSSFKEMLSVANYSLRVQVNKVFPISIFSKLHGAYTGIQKKKNYKKTVKYFKFNAYKKDSLKEQEVYILVIGETARKHNLSIYGYHRKTTPNLDTISNVSVLKNVHSVANLTSLSIPFILTRATPKNPRIKFTEPAIINAFKEANFKTYWLSNQAIGVGSVFGFYSTLADVYKNTAVSIDVANYDEKLLPVFKEVLNDSAPKKFIIIHLLGSHFRYNYRYPEHFKKYKPTLTRDISLENSLDISKKQELINSYDNSILYTDYVLSKFIQEVKKQHANSFLYYISDHGENLFDTKENKILHAYLQPSKYEIEIPLVIWKSKKYIKNFPNKIKNLKRNSTTNILSTNTFHTLLDMANISYPSEDISKSFVNEKFDSIQPQYFYKIDKTLLKLK